MTRRDSTRSPCPNKGPDKGARLSASEVPERHRVWLASLAGEPHACWDTNRPRKTLCLRWVNGRGVYACAARVAAALKYGEVPAGILVRHTCDRPVCCNPEHLVLGTAQDNSDDMVARGRVTRHTAEERARRSAEVKRRHDLGLMRGVQRSGSTHPCARAVMGPGGRTWPTVTEAAKEMRRDPSTIGAHCARRRNGWSYIDLAEYLAPFVAGRG